MDKKSLIGFGLIAVILFLFGYINKPTEEQIRKMKEEQQQKEEAAALMQEETNPAQPMAQLTKPVKATTDSAFVEEVYSLENEHLKIAFTNKGGLVNGVQIKEYQTYGKEDLILFEGAEESFQSLLMNVKERTILTADLNFTKDASRSDEKQLVLVASVLDGQIHFIYKLGDEFKLDFDIEFVNLQQHISRSSSFVEFIWNQQIRSTEKSKDWQNRYTDLSFKYYKDEVDELSVAGDDSKDLNSRLKWVAYKHQFFSSILVAEESFSGGKLESKDRSQEENNYIKEFKANISVPFSKQTGRVSMDYYFLPNKFNILNAASKEDKLQFNELISLGWGIIGWVNEYLVIPIFNFLENHIASYGLIIFLLTLIIKTIIFPFTYKSYVSQAKMKALKPEIDKINEKIPQEKAMERQQETMKLYRKAGVNPLGGCLPMVFQIPILYSLFMFFPVAMELRGESFLWAEDLSSYDSIFQLPFTIPYYGSHVSLFTLLMTITNIVYTRINSANMNTGGQMAAMKYMMYFMPIFFLFFLNNFASGLSYYYFISTLITIVQTVAIKSTIDDQKILAKLEANKKKPQKKSRFQAAIEEAQRKQQAKMKNKR